MKTCLFIEDTPGGLKTKFIWQVSGYQDNAAESISMHVMSNLTLFIKDMEERGLLRIRKEEPPEATTP